MANSSSKRKRFLVIFLVLALLLVAGLVYWLMHEGEESTDDAAIDGAIVTLSPRVAGYVALRHMNDNQLVQAGAVLLEIDPRDYQIRRDKAAAGLEAAEASFRSSTRNLETTSISAPSSLDAARAELASASANWDKARHDLARFQHLSDAARSREQLDAAVAAEKTARAAFENAKAKLRSAETAPKTIAGARATAASLEAQIKAARADLAQAEKDLADTKIIAPITGRITKRAVEQGDYVQPGQQLGALVGNDIWITANFKETQLKHMHPGQHARVHVDALPDLKLEAHVDSIQAGTGARFSTFPPENATGNFVKIVQRVPVKLLLDRLPPEYQRGEAPLPLGPGLSVVPTVETK